jgi:hypothetical protein
MTRTAYIDDLLSTTNDHAAEYEAELREAAAKGTSRRLAIEFEFDVFTHDIERRFEQTIGTAKALQAMAKAAPRTTCTQSQEAKKGLLRLFKVVHADAHFLAILFADHDFDRRTLEDVCARAIKKCGATLDQCRAIVAALEADSFDPREREYWGIKLAAPVIVSRVALDYELLVEQFIDFLREDEQEAAEMLAVAA